MNPFEQMQIKQGAFTATDRQVYEAFINNIDAVLRASATSLAEDFGISQPAITRFCQKLGYRGFSDFRSAVYQHHKSAGENSSPSSAIEWYCKLLQLMPAAMEDADIDLFVERLATSRRIIATGFHKSALSAQLLNLNLLKFGIISSFAPYDQLSVEQGITNEDTLVIFSANSRVYKDVLNTLADNPDERRPHIVLITMSRRNPLNAKVDQVIWLPNYQNQNYSQYLETQVSFMVFIDLLTSALAQRTSQLS